MARESRGEEPLPLQPLLSLGSGINTGMSTVGLMGSSEHIFNYTVFGREVNLASRLESLSGRGRIIVSQCTYEHVKKFEPALAATFLELPPVTTLKGISGPVRVYEVPWKEAESSSNDVSAIPATNAGPAAATAAT